MTTSPSRRSNRIPLSLPVEISGVGPDGEHFSHRASTKTISRHGCSLWVDRPLATQQELLLQRHGTNSVAVGRVVSHIETRSDQNLYGIELQNPCESLWGIQFSSSFHERLLDALNEGLYYVDAQRRITYWSRGAEDISGYSASETVGKHCFEDLLGHEDCAGKSLCRGFCILSETLTDGQTREAVMYLRHKKGHRVPVTTKVVPLRDAGGRVIGAVEMFRPLTVAKKAETGATEFERLAFCDALTGLPNRRYMEFKLSQVFQERSRSETQYGILVIDVDEFKSVNDKYGHDVGDTVLKTVADTLVRSLREEDIVSRWGGEEFVVLLSDVDAIELGDLAERCRSMVSQTELVAHDIQFRLTVSIGGTLLQNFTSARGAVSSADELMYRSKNSGRNCTTLG